MPPTPPPTPPPVNTVVQVPPPTVAKEPIYINLRSSD